MLLVTNDDTDAICQWTEPAGELRSVYRGYRAGGSDGGGGDENDTAPALAVQQKVHSAIRSDLTASKQASYRDMVSS